MKSEYPTPHDFIVVWQQSAEVEDASRWLARAGYAKMTPLVVARWAITLRELGVRLNRKPGLSRFERAIAN